MEKPKLINGILDMLSDMNLEGKQQLPNFHIVKIEGDGGDIPMQSNILSGDIFELAYSVNYNTEMAVDDTRFYAMDSHLTFIAPGQSFYMDIPQEIDLENSLCYLVFFTGDFLKLGPTNYSIIKKFPYFNKHFTPVYYIDDELEELFVSYFKKIHKEFQQLDENSIEIIRSYVLIFMYEIKRLLEKQALKNPQTTRAEEITFLFENLIKATPKKRQKLDFYAEKLNISSIYLAECVKKTTGSSPKKIITEYVLMEAKSMLHHSQHTIEFVGFELGFDQVSNFINFFKKNIGLTPNQFRKQLLV